MSSTPGREALTEAMRLEQARIYTALQREHKNQHIEPAVQVADVISLEIERRRRTA